MVDDVALICNTIRSMPLRHFYFKDEQTVLVGSKTGSLRFIVLSMLIKIDDSFAANFLLENFV